MSVNLLPTSLLPSAGVQKVIKVVRNTTSLLIVTLILMLFGFGAIYVFNFNTIRNIDRTNSELTVRIENLENTEQSLYLLRDRVEKIQKIQGTPNLTDSLEEARELVAFIPEDITIEFMDVSPNTIKFGVSTTTSDNISSFLSNLQASTLFNTVKMDSFNFNQNIGFTAEFTVN